jgi:hypothetical protein
MSVFSRARVVDVDDLDVAQACGSLDQASDQDLRRRGRSVDKNAMARRNQLNCLFARRNQFHKPSPMSARSLRGAERAKPFLSETIL